MLDFPAYLVAQQLTNDVAREALPNAPTIPDSPRRRSTIWLLSRQRASLALHRLADAIEPAPRPREIALAPPCP